MSSAQHKHRNCLVSAPRQWQQSTTVVTYRNCAPWEKPMALYPSFNSGSWASWLHTEDTCAFTSMKKPFSVSCRRGDMKSVERDGQIGGKKTRPVQEDGLWGDKVTVPMMDQSEVGRHNHTAGPWILTHGEGVKEPLSWRNMCQERCKYDRAGSLTCPVDESIPTAIKTNVIFRLKLRTPRLRSSFYGIILIFWCAKQKNVTVFACFYSLPQLWSFQSSGSARKFQRSPPQSSSLSPPCWVGYSSCHLDHMRMCNLQLM